MTRRTAPPRRGFTLIELLVVIAIIAVLVGLTSAAVMKVRSTATRAKEKVTIGQITAAIGSYKAKMNVGYIPAGIKVYDNYTVNPAASDPVAQASLAYLVSVFPQIDRTNTRLGSAYGDGKVLDGNQTLVLFLTGGIPTKGTGFATSRVAPFAPGAAGDQRIGPFYESIAKIDGNGHLLDSWGSPYAYFAHNPTAGLGNYQGSYTPGPTEAFRTNNVTPYQYLEPKFVQVISAGPNKRFGPGGFWQPGAGAYTEAGDGGDDLANFNAGPLLAQTN